MDSGFIFYEGDSCLLPDVKVLGIATLNSNNIKTGNLIQTWILPTREMSPLDELKLGKSAICGDCQLRNNGCYVEVGKAPMSVWKKAVAFNPNWSPYKYITRDLHDFTNAIHENGHKKLNEIYNFMHSRSLRIGSYGDPAAIPITHWYPLILSADRVVGYTHQWKPRPFHVFKPYLMASVQTREQATEAQKLGWRTFRIIQKGEDLIPNEILCTNERTNGKVPCEGCMLCSGGTGKHIAITAHGRDAARVHQQEETTN